MPWEPTKEPDFCSFHPDVKMVWKKKHLGKTRRSKLWWFQCCDECEWNPPDLGNEGNDRTAPNIPNVFDRY